MNASDQAIRIAGLIQQLRDLYKRHNDVGPPARARQAMHSECQAIDSCRTQLGDAIWDLSRGYREQSKQILAQAFKLAEGGAKPGRPQAS